MWKFPITFKYGSVPQPLMLKQMFKLQSILNYVSWGVDGLSSFEVVKVQSTLLSPYK